jgi:hypothetical protein
MSGTIEVRMREANAEGDAHTCKESIVNLRISSSRHAVLYGQRLYTILHNHVQSR